MMQRWSRVQLIVMVLALAIFMTVACGQQGAGTPGDQEELASHYLSPLSDYLGYDMAFVPVEARRQPSALDLAFGDLLTVCMKGEGFEWWAYEEPHRATDAGGIYAPVGLDGLEWGTEAWVQRYGFGISTLAFPQAAVGDSLVGYLEAMVGPAEDPNVSYIENLDEIEREAYFLALEDKDGCYARAERGVYESELFQAQDSFYREFGEDIDNMLREIETDRRILDYEQKLSDCMFDKGYRYDGFEMIEDEIQGRLSSILLDDDASDPKGGQSALSSEAQSRLASIQTYEISAALSIQECGGGVRVMEQLYNEIRIELEHEFVEANGRELARVRHSS